ncbi:MAG TPA: flavin reductase family protein [Planctomycetota bacterium]|jgi:flavin reductase (DIM6/NTAB) family NADH-FMN oxidoreductase RutF|nr:flavin reductase family protein [Planctomycetota bacterium]
MQIDPAALSPRDAYQLMISCIAPRPIAFVTTISREGMSNLAPFSFFNGVSSNPPILSLAISTKRNGSKKDTWRNIEETGEFVVNVVVPDLMDAVLIGARELPHNVSELELARLDTLPSVRIKPPRIAASPVQMECTLLKIVEVEETGLILGRVVMVHAEDNVVDGGRVDPRRLTFVGRLGGDTYCRVNDLFERRRD